MDVWTGADTCEQITLPGTNLGHGYTSAVDKAVAFLWSLFLVCGGVTLHVLESVLCDMRSMCTDFGVESGIAALPNFLEQWAAVLGLSVSERFKQWPRLFPLMVFVPDFNHLTSNVMNRVFTMSKRWPAFLSHMQALCKFFNHAEYRSTLRQLLVKDGHREMARALAPFSSSFAHWR